MELQASLTLPLPDGQQQVFSLSAASLTVGRATTNDIVLQDGRISRHHARIEATPQGYALVDLGSANGTQVNGSRIERATLRPGDLVQLGASTLRFDLVEKAGSTANALPSISEDDFEETIGGATVAMTMTNHRVPRLAIHTPSQTWEIPLIDDNISIGRDAENRIALDDPKASRMHARIERRGDSFLLRDLNSRNGTWLGEARVQERMLRNGDTFRVGSASILFKLGFEPQDLTLAGSATIAAAPAVDDASPRQPVVIVPGLGGSELYLGSDRVWPNAGTMLRNPDALRYPGHLAFEPRGLVGEVVIIPNVVKLQQYNRLGDYLEEGLGYERGKDLFEFSYDFRQDIRVSAKQLAAKIEEWSPRGPIAIIAHSLGTLVSRYYVRRLGGNRRVGRLVLLGGPHQGTPKILSTLLVGAPILPFGIMADRFREILLTWPSVYQFLPLYPCTTDQAGRSIDIFQDESWLRETFRPHLRSAAELHREIAGPTGVPTVCIFGYGVKTESKLNVVRDQEGNWQKVDVISEPEGDSSVPEKSAILPNAEIHPVQQYHGSLYVDNDVKMRLKLELAK